MFFVLTYSDPNIITKSYTITKPSLAQHNKARLHHARRKDIYLSENLAPILFLYMCHNRPDPGLLWMRLH